MHQVTIRHAKIHLSRPIQDALKGEEAVIARGRKPVVRLTLRATA
jgi:antitoxin (DNA-binding transcriptional repressor) of toxin-antitoxin stability system